MKKKQLIYYEGYRLNPVRGLRKFRIPYYKKTPRDEKTFYLLWDLLKHYYEN